MNRKEYNIAVEKQTSRLYGFVYSYLRNVEDSQDIVQDTFEKLWNNRKKVEFDKAKAWLFRTAYNGLINLAKRNQKIVYDNEQIPEQFVTNNRFEYKELVDLAVSLLPPQQKSIILLRDLEGYTYDEIGEILDLSESQVKVYLYRARKKIKKQLSDIMLVQ